MPTIKVRERQTFLDIAMQCCGTVESVFELAALSGRSITDQLTPGELLPILPQPVNRIVEQYYRTNELFPASDDPNTALDAGIEYDNIEEPEPYTQPY